MKQYAAELFINHRYELAESPFANVKTGELSFVDIEAGKIFCIRDGKVSEEADMKQRVGAAIPLADGAVLAAATDGLYRVEKGEKSLLCDLTGVYKDYHRSNDAKLDPRGRLFFGSTTWREGHGDGGNLYMYDGGSVSVLQPDTKISNGMAWSSDNNKFYFSDSLEHAVFEYDYDLESGKISNRRVLFEINDGVPDGMCIDKKGRLFVAVWGGYRIECHDSVSGSLLFTIKLPAKQVSSCCFCDENETELFITSAGVGLSGESDGCLFKCNIE